MEGVKQDRLLTLMMLPPWALHLALIWSFRFVPSIDYPEWLFQSNILAHYHDPLFNFSQMYDLIFSPIPNAGFVLPTALFSTIVPIEVAGKLILSLYVVWFPLSLRSYYKATSQHSMYWVIGVLILFNISFFNGNFNFLIGLCLLFSSLSYVERRRGRFRFREFFVTAVLTLLIFLSHAVCAIVFLLYSLFRFFERGTTPVEKRMFSLFAVENLALTAFYLATKPQNRMITVFDWLPDLRYRLLLVTKPFFVGWSYPPYEFSLFRFLTTSLFVVVGVTMAVFSIPTLRKKFSESSPATLTVVVALMTLLGPKNISGIAELSHRFALVSLPLVAGFIKIPERLTATMRWTLVALAYLAILACWKDYRDSSLIIEKRNDFLHRHLQPGDAILTLDDDLGESKAPFLHLVPKGVSFTFQADYFMMGGGCNSFSFPTSFLIPRDTFIVQFYRLASTGGLDGVLGLRGTDIPHQVRFIIIDSASDWGKRLAHGLASRFHLIAEEEIVPGVRTIVLERTS